MKATNKAGLVSICAVSILLGGCPPRNYYGWNYRTQTGENAVKVDGVVLGPEHISPDFKGKRKQVFVLMAMYTIDRDNAATFHLDQVRLTGSVDSFTLRRVDSIPYKATFSSGVIRLLPGKTVRGVFVFESKREMSKKEYFKFADDTLRLTVEHTKDFLELIPKGRNVDRLR